MDLTQESRTLSRIYKLGSSTVTTRSCDHEKSSVVDAEYYNPERYQCSDIEGGELCLCVVLLQAAISRRFVGVRALSLRQCSSYAVVSSGTTFKQFIVS